MSQKNMTLEILKVFASYMVVFIHILFYGSVGTVMDALARFAVPLFFLISGFYSYGISPEKILKRTKHILYLFLFTAICYHALKILPLLLARDFEGLRLFVGKYLDIKAFLILLLFNEPAQGLYTWYFLAAIYVYLCFYVATRCKLKSKLLFPVCCL